VRGRGWTFVVIIRGLRQSVALLPKGIRGSGEGTGCITADKLKPVQQDDGRAADEGRVCDSDRINGHLKRGRQAPTGKVSSGHLDSVFPGRGCRRGTHDRALRPTRR